MSTFAHFAVTPYPVISSRIIGGNEKTLYGVITMRLEVPGYCIVSNKEFSQFFGVDERTITTWLSNLEKNGFIRIVQNKHKHRRQIYLHKFPSPPDEIEPNNLSDKQRKFAEAFPERSIDIAEIPDFVNMDLLIKFIKSSKFLADSKNLSLKWFVMHYKTVIAGGYKDYDRKKSSFSTERDFTKEEMNSLFQDISEIEI